MELSVKQVYTSIACNRTPEIVDWNSNGLICFGATNAVVIYDTRHKGKDPLTVLSHHTSKVNSVKWVTKPHGSCMELLSCSADKTAAIWSYKNKEWKATSKLTGHTDGVTCVFGVLSKENNLIIYTGSIDSTVKVWERINDEVSLKQSISLNSGLCLTLHAHLLPLVDKPMLFCALDDHKIHVFASDEEYHQVHTLVGHEDWVRGMDVLNVDNNTILLASGSQDTYIRLWRIQLHTAQAPTSEIRVEEKVFQAYGQDWSVKLDAVLAGHEGWVYGVQWHPYAVNKANVPTNSSPVKLKRTKDTPSPPWFDSECAELVALRKAAEKTYNKAMTMENYVKYTQVASLTKKILRKKKMKESYKPVPVYRLLSSSLDKTLIVWEPEGGAWVERVRVGEAGGNGLGFYGSRFGPKGDKFLGHGYNGSFHIWSVCKESGQWEPQVVCGGHFGCVEDVRWEPGKGRYLTSVSADQTTRVHAPWIRDGFDPEWHEIARPQVHGYDLASLALVNSTTFASAAEEKVIRVFRAPHNFLTNFASIAGDQLVDEGAGGEGVGAEGASVPSLGLSNKAVFSAAPPDEDDRYFVPVTLTEPPTEEMLMQNTLWPELQKLYGHGYEVFALDASADGTLLASACKATTAEHAAVLIWETTNWQQIQKLVSHQLTVTQLAFAPNSQQLVSVSRDRRWTLYQRVEGSNSFAIAASTDKTNGVHSRIIWCCAWAHDSAMFATGSREGKVCVWSKTEAKQESSLSDYALFSSHLETNSSVTALAFAPLLLDASRLVAVGMESGVVKIYSFVGAEWSLLHEMSNSEAHHLTVRRLSFNPQIQEADANKRALLASCGSDHLVRIHSVDILMNV